MNITTHLSDLLLDPSTISYCITGVRIHLILYTFSILLKATTNEDLWLNPYLGRFCGLPRCNRYVLQLTCLVLPFN